MPLVILSGNPCTGKTTFANHLCSYLKKKDENTSQSLIPYIIHFLIPYIVHFLILLIPYIINPLIPYYTPIIHSLSRRTDQWRIAQDTEKRSIHECHQGEIDKRSIEERDRSQTECRKLCNHRLNELHQRFSIWIVLYSKNVSNSSLRGVGGVWWQHIEWME